MFATKRDTEKWIEDFAPDMGFEPGRYGKYWRVFDPEGSPLTQLQRTNKEDVGQ